jgi:hypothetical protein
MFPAVKFAIIAKKAREETAKIGWKIFFGFSANLINKKFAIQQSS